MRTAARGFILFSFAFSSVLSSPEIGVVTENAQAKWNPSSRSLLINITNNNNNVAIKRDYITGKNLYHLRRGNIAKREISDSLYNKIGSFESPRDRTEPDGRRSSFPASEDAILNNEKRARVGFTGMRGKKDGFLSGSYVGKRNQLEGENLKGRESNEFLGLIDKESGMELRRKKYDGHYDKLREMVFHGMRGKKDGYAPYGENTLECDILPRAAAAEKEVIDEPWEKRRMAFHGMRGRSGNPAKRDPLALAGTDGYEYEFNRVLRFLGMRGKKSPESWNWGSNLKRRSQPDYFGSKGKKAQSGFFGMRGKKSLPKGCLQIEGEKEILDNETSSSSSISSPTRRIRRGPTWLRNSKKAKNAFFAARGKKSPPFFRR